MTDFGSSRARPARGGGTWALLLAILACIVWSLGGMAGSLEEWGQYRRSGEHGLGFVAGLIIGSTLVIAAVVWAVMCFAVIRRTAPGRGPAYFVVLWAVAAGVQLAALGVLETGSASRQREEAVAMRSVDAAAQALADPSRKTAIDTRPQARGEIGILEGMTKRMIADIAFDNRAFETEIKALGLEDVLSAASISADPRLTRTRDGLRRGREIVTAHRARRMGRVAQMRRDLEASPLSKHARAEARAGFDAGFATTSMRVWDAQIEQLDALDSAAELLQRARGRWVVEGDMVMFHRTSDMNAFNGHIERAEKLRLEAVAAQAAALDRTRSAFQPAPTRAP